MPVNVVDQNMFSKGNVERKLKLLNSNRPDACFFKTLCHIINIISSVFFPANQMFALNTESRHPASFNLKVLLSRKAVCFLDESKCI